MKGNSVNRMEQKIDEYFKEISKGDYEKFEDLILNDYEEIRKLYFVLKDYSHDISSIEYNCDIDNDGDIIKDVVIIVIHTIDNTIDIKNKICDNIPEFDNVTISGNIINIYMEEY